MKVTPMSSSNNSSKPKKKKASYLDGDYTNLADLAEKVDWFTVSVFSSFMHWVVTFSIVDGEKNSSSNAEFGIPEVAKLMSSPSLKFHSNATLLQRYFPSFPKTKVTKKTTLWSPKMTMNSFKEAWKWRNA